MTLAALTYRSRMCLALLLTAVVALAASATKADTVPVRVQPIAEPMFEPVEESAGTPSPGYEPVEPVTRTPRQTVATPAVTPSVPMVRVVTAQGDTITLPASDSIATSGVELLDTIRPKSAAKPYVVSRHGGGDPQRALWLSALCPGLGQIYNGRYWKLPIVVGAFVGLTYATAWNNRMLQDYTRAYRDVMDDDPGTRSYMDFYPPTTDESSIDVEWLKRALRNKKNYYRRYRDLSIIGLVAMYGLCIIDAYVDASLSSFDISPNLSMHVAPAVMDTQTGAKNAALGLRCAVNF